MKTRKWVGEMEVFQGVFGTFPAPVPAHGIYVIDGMGSWSSYTAEQSLDDEGNTNTPPLVDFQRSRGVWYEEREGLESIKRTSDSALPGEIRPRRTRSSSALPTRSDSHLSKHPQKWNKCTHPDHPKSNPSFNTGRSSGVRRTRVDQ